jgi:hypothetical protein
MLQLLDRHGRFCWDPQNNPMSGLSVADMYFLAQADLDGFLHGLAALTVPAGGWVALGGKYLVMDILPLETNTPDFNAIVLAGFQFLREHGVPPNRLSPNDKTLWERARPDHEPWLIWRDPPADKLTPLAPGEVRKVAEILRADGYVNELLVRQDGPEQFATVIRGAYSETDPRIVENEWFTAQTLHAAYLRIGEGNQIPPQWAHPELQPYFPLPPMTI